MPNKFSGKTFIITGASSGIGKEIAIEVDRLGASVVLASRNEQKLKELASQLKNSEVIPTDVTNPQQVKSLFLEVSKTRTIDAVFNNAGLGFVDDLAELKINQISDMVNVNLLGMIYVAKYASEVMIRQKYGHIIFTSSIAAFVKIPQWSVYNATKWGITAFADSIRFELRKDNVKVSTIHPGAVDTEFFATNKANIPTQRLGPTLTAKHVAEVALQTVFTKRKTVIIPAYMGPLLSIYRQMPGIANLFIDNIIGKMRFHQQVPEDEPDFNFIKPVS